MAHACIEITTLYKVHSRRFDGVVIYFLYSASALPSAVLARGIPSVCPSRSGIVLCPDEWR